MPKYTKTSVTQLSANEQAAIDQINKNFDDIQVAIADTVSRSGAIPSHMTADLDMNGKRIINVPTPTSDLDLVRRKDVVDDIATVQALVNTTTTAAAQTLEAAQAVQEILEDEHVGLVADDLALGENSKIKQTADNISDVTTVADNMTAINTCNTNATNISTVATNISNVNSVGSNISNVNTCASNMSAITSAPTYASNASGSANDALGYANAAAASAATATTAASTMRLSLFDHKWADHLLNDQSWLRSDTFSWQDGTVYSNAYDHLVNDIGYVRYMIPDDDLQIKFYRAPAEDTEMYAWTNQFSTLYTVSEFPQNGDDFYYHNQVAGTVLSTGVELGPDAVTPTTETVGSYTITYYPCADGHKVVLADQETTASNIYNESGVAWYYILDTTNQRFKLPRTMFGFTGLRDTVGKYVEAGLPNIAGSINVGSSFQTRDENGALYSPFPNASVYTSGGGAQNTSYGVGIDASRYNSIYGNSSTVQPPATQMYLYFYVGQFSQSATEQTAGLNTELFNDKMDNDRIQEVSVLPVSPDNGVLYLIPE